MSEQQEAPEAPETPAPSDGERSVPYSRLAEVVNQLRAAEKQVGVLELERDKATLALERVQSEAESTKATFEEQIAKLQGDASWGEVAVKLAAEGYSDARALRIIRREFEERATPEEGERPGFEDWWSTESEAYASLFGKGAPAKPAKQAPPKVDRGAKPTTDAPLSEAALLNMSQDEWRSLGAEGQAAAWKQVRGES